MKENDYFIFYSVTGFSCSKSCTGAHYSEAKVRSKKKKIVADVNWLNHLLVKIEYIDRLKTVFLTLTQTPFFSLDMQRKNICQCWRLQLASSSALLHQLEKWCVSVTLILVGVFCLTKSHFFSFNFESWKCNLNQKNWAL